MHGSTASGSGDIRALSPASSPSVGGGRPPPWGGGREAKDDERKGESTRAYIRVQLSRAHLSPL